MSDTLPSLPDFLGTETDEELVFDDDALEAVFAAAAPIVTDAQPARAPRRRAKSAKAGTETIAHPETPAIEAPANTESAEALLHASADEPAGGAHAPFPPHGAMPAGSTFAPRTWLLGIVALATVSSFTSLGGLLMVSRTLAHAEADRAQAATERASFARIPDLVARLDAASVRLDTAAQHASAASPSGPPATVAEVRHELDMLKLALAGHKPDGLDALNSNIQGSFQDLATRLERISKQLPGGRSASVEDAPAAAAEIPVHAAPRGPHGRAVHPRNGTAFKD